MTSAAMVTHPAADAVSSAVNGLEPTTAEQLLKIFVPFLGRAQEWETRARAIVVTDENDKRTMKFARESRLALRDIRVGVEHARKAAKADALSRSKAIDGIANSIKGLIEPLEAHLLEQETYGERAAAARVDALKAARSETLIALGAEPSLYVNLGELDEDAWSTVLESAKAARDARVEAVKKAEAIRLEAERIALAKQAEERAAAIRVEAERVERERLQTEENARLRAEKEAIERAARSEREKAAKAVADELAARLASERSAAEQAAKERAQREAAESEARKAREEADRVNAELAKVREASAQAKADAERAAAVQKEVVEPRSAHPDAPTAARYQALVGALQRIAGNRDEEPIAASIAIAVLTDVGVLVDDDEGPL